MRAVRLHAAGEPLRVEELPLPAPAGTEVRIRVAGAGVCHTDLLVADGTLRRVDLPITLGHEVAGHVDAVGPDAEAPLRRARLELGAPVVVHGGWGCGHCGECRDGAEQRCSQSRAPGFQVDGGYAEAMIVPHPRHLVPLGRLDPVHAAPLADAGVTPYRAVLRAVPWLRPGARVLLIGCGALGQFALQLLRIVPESGDELRIAVRELAPSRLDRASELGADVVVLAGDASMVRDALGGSADVIFDFVGADSTLALASELLAPGGLLTLVGEAGGTLAFGFERAAVESWLTTVAWGSLSELRDVVRLAARGRLRWSVETMPLSEAAAAHDRLRAGSVEGRLVLVP